MNDTIVLKFGGTSLGTPERIRAVAARISRLRSKHSRVVVTVSAMGHTTDELIALALQVSPNCETPPYRREMDMLLTVGERISMALLSMALQDLGIEAISLTGSQSGIITDTKHGEARIAEVRPQRILENLEKGRVVIVAGFQGVSLEKEITTLGRGGSDTSATALAVALKARFVEICTDVLGVFTADPRVVPDAVKLDSMPWDLALSNAKAGSAVLHPPCVEIALQNKMPIHLCSSFEEKNGTWIEGFSQEVKHSPLLAWRKEEGADFITVIGAGGEQRHFVRELLKTENIIFKEQSPDTHSLAFRCAALGDKAPELLRKIHKGLISHP